MRFLSCSRVLASFTGRGETDLSVSEGQLVYVTHTDAPRKGWALAIPKDDLESSDQKDAELLPMKAIPMDFIEELPLLGFGATKWRYSANRPDELSTTRGERLHIHLAGQLEWWVVSRSGGQNSIIREWGIIPANFLENIEAAPPPTPSKSRPAPVPVLPRSLHAFPPGFVPAAAAVLRAMMPTSPTELAAFPGEIVSVLDSTEPLRWRCARDRPHGGVEVGYAPADGLRVVAWKEPRMKPNPANINSDALGGKRSFLSRDTANANWGPTPIGAPSEPPSSDSDSRRKGLFGKLKMNNVFGKKGKDSDAWAGAATVMDAPPQLPPMRSAAARVNPNVDTMKPLPNPSSDWGQSTSRSRSSPPSARTDASRQVKSNNSELPALPNDVESHPQSPVEDTPLPVPTPTRSLEGSVKPSAPVNDLTKVKAGKIKIVPVVKEGSRPPVHEAEITSPVESTLMALRQRAPSAAGAVAPKFLGINLDPDPTSRADVRPIWLSRHYREQLAEETAPPRTATTPKLISVQKEKDVVTTALMRPGAAQAPYPVLYTFAKGTSDAMRVEWIRFIKDSLMGDRVVVRKGGEEEFEIPMRQLTAKDRAYVEVRAEYEAGYIPLYPRNWTDTSPKARGRFKAFLLGCRGGWAFLRELHELVYLEFSVDISNMIVGDREYVEEVRFLHREGLLGKRPAGAPTGRPPRHFKAPSDPPDLDFSKFPTRGVATLKRILRFIGNHLGGPGSRQSSSCSIAGAPPQPRRGFAEEVTLVTALTFIYEQRILQASYIEPLVEQGHSRERAWAVSEALAKSVGGSWGSGDMTAQTLIQRLEAMSPEVSVKDIWRGAGVDVTESSTSPKEQRGRNAALSDRLASTYPAVGAERWAVSREALLRLLWEDPISMVMIWDLGFEESRTRRSRESLKGRGVFEVLERVVEEALRTSD